MMASQSKIRCRQIGISDLDSVIDLLERGFPSRTRDYWVLGLERQTGRPVPCGLPRFGYLLEGDGKPVGVLLLLFTSFDVGEGKPEIRCNLSSWYVEPAYRSCASLLVSVALRHKGVTFMNISPAQHTWPIIEALGFSPYCTGQFTALSWLNPPRLGVRVKEVSPDDTLAVTLSARERDLMSAHAGYGCLTLVCSAPDGDHPFIFQRFMRWHDRVPCMRLIYCRELDEFVRFAGPLGRTLLRRGIPLVLLDSNGPVAGLVGAYQDVKGRKYFKGPDKPRLGDLAYTELPLFGP
jgi:hypothetical protein